MEKILLAIYLYILASSLSSFFAQNSINNVIFNKYSPERYYDVVIKNDTILTMGVGFSKIKEKWIQGIVFTQFDTTGKIIKSKIFMDTLKGSLSVFFNYGNLINLKDGGYSCIVAVQREEIVLFLKLNNNLEVEFIKEYEDSSYIRNFYYKMLEINDGYLLYGAIQYMPKQPNKNSPIVGFVRRIDKKGNTIWLKEFKPSLYLNAINDMKIINDSTYTFLLNSEIESDPFDPVVFHSLYVINDKGNTIKSWRTQNSDPNYWYIDKLVAADEGEILTFGHKFIDIYFKGPVITERNYQPYFAAFDTKTLATKWQKNCGIKSNSDFIYNGLWDFTKTIDNNYVGAGTMGLADYLVKDYSESWAWLNKFTPQGEEIWSRKIAYPSNLPDSIQQKDKKAGSLFAVGTLSSGSILAAGYVSESNSTYGYLVKMTNDGCLDTLFKCDKTTDVKEEIVDNQGFITIYPNPANEVINIKFKDNLKGYQFSLRDSGGKICKSSSIEKGVLETQLLTENVPSGFYFLAIESKFSKSIFHKIIIIH